MKVLERVFYRPLLDNGFSDLVNLLFPNLPEMLEIHGRFNAMMKARKRDQPVVESVGDILLAMVRPALFQLYELTNQVIALSLSLLFYSLTGRMARISNRLPQHFASTSRSLWKT